LCGNPKICNDARSASVLVRGEAEQFVGDPFH
jgi:hypothetical protein